MSREKSVLLVDDDSLIRAIGQDVITMLGYTAVTAADGTAAIGAVTTEPGAVILDDNLPDMTGFAVLQALRVRWPDLPIILSTGSMRHDAARLAREGWTAVLPKPYSLTALAEVLGRLLESTD